MEYILIPGTVVNAKNLTVESLPSILLHSSGRRQITFILILLWVENGFNGNNKNKDLEGDASVAGTQMEWGFRQLERVSQTEPSSEQTLTAGHKQDPGIQVVGKGGFLDRRKRSIQQSGAREAPAVFQGWGQIVS